jgi:peptidoglycan-N-acetylglucosamine deacetylase
MKSPVRTTRTASALALGVLLTAVSLAPASAGPTDSPTPTVMSSTVPSTPTESTESPTPLESPTPVESPTPLESPTPVESPTPLETPPPTVAPTETPIATKSSVMTTDAAATTSSSPGEEAIAQKYLAVNGVTLLGAPQGDPVCGLVLDGCRQDYEKGAIFWSPATGAQYSKGGILSKYRTLNAQAGFLGYPTTDEICGLTPSGCRQDYQGGSIYWSSSTNSRYVKGAILGKYRTLNAQAGFLGYPTTDEICGLAGGGCRHSFQGGAIFWHPQTGARFMKGAILNRYLGLGGQNSALGYPRSDEICGLRDGGCRQIMQRGTFGWSRATGAHPVVGAINNRWASLGYEASAYRYPRRAEACRTMAAGVSLCTGDFQGGTITWRSDKGIIDCARLKCIALTFDDGPGAYTSQLLNSLDAGGAQATFFLVGNRVSSYAPLVARMGRLDMEIANHSWSHPNLTTLGSSSITSQLSTTSDVIRSVTGKRPTLMRPPYGAYNSTVTSVSRQQGLAVIMWNVDTLDWKYRSSSYVRSAAVNNARNGAIILMHDIHPTTVNAVPGIISDLKARGYTMVTTSDLIGFPQAGQVYSKRPGS